MILSISWPLAKMALIQILLCLPLAFALEPQKVLPTFEESGYGPSIDTASSNAASIFNTIHSSMVCCVDCISVRRGVLGKLLQSPRASTHS